MDQNTMEQGSSARIWLVIGVVVVAVAAAFWYLYYPKQAVAPEQSGIAGTAAEPPQAATLGSGNTTADISADLAGTPDDSAALDAAASAAARDVSGL